VLYNIIVTKESVYGLLTWTNALFPENTPTSLAFETC